MEAESKKVLIELSKNKIERSEAWNNIYEVLARLDLKETIGDAMDRPSAATELEALFLKLLALQNVRSRSFNELEYQAEQNECANMYLNDLGIPTEDSLGEKYSTVGRIKYLEQNGF